MSSQRPGPAWGEVTAVRGGLGVERDSESIWFCVLRLGLVSVENAPVLYLLLGCARRAPRLPLFLSGCPWGIRLRLGSPITSTLHDRINRTGTDGRLIFFLWLLMCCYNCLSRTSCVFISWCHCRVWKVTSKMLIYQDIWNA